jgi:DNA topoisomerase-6 subunit B
MARVGRLSGKASFSEISPSEFFYRNRDLAGFTNPARALYMAVRELVENSMDACEFSGVPPDVYVRLVADNTKSDMPDPRPYRLSVADNGPGVDPGHVPSAFGKVFYGSKYVLRQSRGMFGLGGTMTILYGQITSNKPVIITTSPDGVTKYSFEMLIDIAENKPVVLKRETSDAGGRTGTRVDLTLEGDFPRASAKIAEYFKQTALVASYANLTFVDPFGQVSFFERATTQMPLAPKETLPHPYGIDVEAFKRIVKLAEENNLKTFMVKHFHRVGDKIASKFLAFAGMDEKLSPNKLNNQQIVAIVDALQRYPDFLQPDATCLSPVGDAILRAGITKELEPEFSTVVTRPPSSYSGFPFLVEVGLAYGSKTLPPGVKLYRFANRIPLLYDESSDVSFKVLNEEIDWRRYHVPQDAPVAIITHICSTKIPYKTVGKEYIADRPEIERELRNATREALRQLSIFLSRKGSMEAVQRKMNIYGKYLPLIAKFATELAEQKRTPRYRKLIGEGGEVPETEADVAEAETEQIEKSSAVTEGKPVGQRKIEDYS